MRPNLISGLVLLAGSLLLLLLPAPWRYAGVPVLCLQIGLDVTKYLRAKKAFEAEKASHEAFEANRQKRIEAGLAERGEKRRARDEKKKNKRRT